MGLGGAGIAWVIVVMLRGLLVAMAPGSPLIFSGGVRDPATMCDGSVIEKDTSELSISILGSAVAHMAWWTIPCNLYLYINSKSLALSSGNPICMCAQTAGRQSAYTPIQILFLIILSFCKCPLFKGFQIYLFLNLSFSDLHNSPRLIQSLGRTHQKKFLNE